MWYNSNARRSWSNCLDLKMYKQKFRKLTVRLAAIIGVILAMLSAGNELESVVVVCCATASPFFIAARRRSQRATARLLTPTMAATMAAALAASLPAPTANITPATPSHDAIPASMAKVIDIEADIPLSEVQLDALVVTKIIKHGREAPSSTAHGLLLGLDLDGTLEVSNSFPLPHHGGDDDDKSNKSIGVSPYLTAMASAKPIIARYQASMLRSLKEVQADDSVIGFYQATTLGAFFNQTLIDTQAIHQEKLRHGGIVIVHGMHANHQFLFLSPLTKPTRPVSNRPRECLVPRIQTDHCLFGRVQKIKL